MRLDHVAMYVKDIERVKEFFIKYFDAKSNNMYHNKVRGFRSYFLTFKDGARLEIMNLENMENEEIPFEKMGYVHIAFSVGSKEKVDELTKTLEGDGYKIMSGPRITGDGYYESCFIGIEGNVIEITN